MSTYFNRIHENKTSTFIKILLAILFKIYSCIKMNSKEQESNVAKNVQNLKKLNEFLKSQSPNSFVNDSENQQLARKSNKLLKKLNESKFSKHKTNILLVFFIIAGLFFLFYDSLKIPLIFAVRLVVIYVKHEQYIVSLLDLIIYQI